MQCCRRKFSYLLYLFKENANFFFFSFTGKILIQNQIKFTENSSQVFTIKGICVKIYKNYLKYFIFSYRIKTTKLKVERLWQTSARLLVFFF